MQRDSNLAVLPDPASEPAPVADKRKALLRAALELFAERTYSAAPVPDIAARAHVGTGTVYRHFQSKEDLANAVFQGCKTTMLATLQAALAAGGSAEQRFLAIWNGLASMAAADPTAMRFLELQHHEEYLDEHSRALRDRVFTTAEGFIRDGQQSGEIRPIEPCVAIALVFGAFVGLFKESCAGRFALDQSAVAGGGACAWRMIAGER